MGACDKFSRCVLIFFLYSHIFYRQCSFLLLRVWFKFKFVFICMLTSNYFCLKLNYGKEHCLNQLNPLGSFTWIFVFHTWATPITHTLSLFFWLSFLAHMNLSGIVQCNWSLKMLFIGKENNFPKHFISPFHYKAVVKASQIKQWYFQDFIKHCEKTLLCHFQWCSCWWFRLSFIVLLAGDVSLCYCFV